MVPDGLVSVMPQPCRNSVEYSSQNQRIISLGGAEPPQMMRRTRQSYAERSFSSIPRTVCHTVGTAAEKVAFQSLQMARVSVGAM
jgi:hypothetical protein